MNATEIEEQFARQHSPLILQSRQMRESMRQANEKMKRAIQEYEQSKDRLEREEATAKRRLLHTAPSA